MLGAIIGDIVGSRFEWYNIKSKEFEFFTSDCKPTDASIMTLAIAKAFLSCNKDHSNLANQAVACMQELAHRYPNAGYGGRFIQWLGLERPKSCKNLRFMQRFSSTRPKPYGSFGNGSAMRVSPCAYAAATLDEALALQKLRPLLPIVIRKGYGAQEPLPEQFFLLYTIQTRGRSRSLLRKITIF